VQINLDNIISDLYFRLLFEGMTNTSALLQSVTIKTTIKGIMDECMHAPHEDDYSSPVCYMFT